VQEKKISRLIDNWVSTTGAVIAAMAGLTMLFFLIISLFAKTSNPYLGILLYMVLPVFLVTGLIVLLVGMYIEWAHLQKQGSETTPRKWPHVDLDKPHHRRTVLIFLLGTTLFVLMSAFGVYQAYHYTESIEFCGLTCHKVMHPEYVVYQDSPHARIKCVECHIGPGAAWYVQAKLSGLYQVYAVVANNFSRPIPTPVENLRPAQSICEQCHWPDKFFGAKQWQFDHYFYDKPNTYWPINMLIKTGGGNPKTSQTSGIHWHMNIGVTIEYVARDARRQDIPWIKATDKKTGQVTVYQDKANPLTKEALAAAKPRVMDCIDCHSRPSHDFRSPDHDIDLSLVLGRIDPAIPEIKKTAVGSLMGEYKTETEARNSIERTITDYYRTKHPAAYAQKTDAIKNAISAVQGVYSRNFFPTMKVKWADYPNNIGHFNFPGCMRCHDGKHVTSKGVAISKDCNSCHIILSQGPKKRGSIINADAGLPFVHPVEIGAAWKDGNCYDCHRGVQP
jgi:hypothetical protein